MASSISQLLLMAGQHFNAGRYPDAETVCRKVLSVDSENGDALHLLGLSAFQSGKAADAVRLLAHAASVRPDDPACLNNLGQALRATGHLPQAEACYRRAAAVDPNHAEALANLALVLTQAGKPAEAVEPARRAVALRPDLPGAHAALAEALSSSDPPAALEAFREALELDPDQPDVLNNAGGVLLRNGDVEDAAEAFRRAIARVPRFPQAMNNLGVAYTRLGKPQDALAAFERAITMAGDFAPAHANHATTLLTLGDFDRGWREYEWRWAAPALPGQKPRTLTNPLPPMTEDPDLSGKTVLVYAEQGFGDVVHFARYLPLLARRGARVVLAEVPPPLVQLLRSIEGVADVIAAGVASEAGDRASDFQANLLTLPLLFRTTVETIPAAVPYVGPSPDKLAHWRARLAGDRQLKVGLCWAGNPEHSNDRLRSIDPALLAPLFGVDGVSVYSLQREAARRPAHPFIDPTKDISDFDDMAALITNLDVVVTVDTSIAHVAGALAKETFVLLPLGPDFRWLLDRTDSPWYPTARLFRQSTLDDWKPVVAAVAAALRDRR